MDIAVALGWFDSVIEELLKNDAYPVLDAPCGSGRFARRLADAQLQVVALDNDSTKLERLKKSLTKEHKKYISPVCADIYDCYSLYGEGSFGAVINIEFVDLSLFSQFASLLNKGGLLFIKTFENRGENYLDLPAPGAYERASKQQFKMLRYSEKHAGPEGIDAVTVSLLCCKI